MLRIKSLKCKRKSGYTFATNIAKSPKSYIAVFTILHIRF